MYLRSKMLKLSRMADIEITNFILKIIKSKIYNKFVVGKDLSRISLVEVHKWVWLKDNRSVPKPIISKGDRVETLSNGLYLIRFRDNKTFGLFIVRDFTCNKVIDDEIVRDYTKKPFIYIIGKNRIKYMLNLEKYLSHQFSSKRDMHNLRTIMNISCMTMTEQRADTILLRDLDSIEINKDDKNMISNSISKFISNTDMYRKLNISHKLGIMLYGEPGCGKTSMVRAIINEIDKTINTCPNIYKVNCSDPDTLQKLNKINAYNLVILIFEEIDCIIPNREVESDLDSKKALYSLLEFLDGVSNNCNVISIATTNHIEDLDPALLRHGRFDIKIKMGKIDRVCAEHMCKRFNLSKEDTDKLLDTIEFPVNPAYLQNKILFDM